MKAIHLALTVIALGAVAQGQHLDRLPPADPPAGIDSDNITVDITMFGKGSDAGSSDLRDPQAAGDESRDEATESADEAAEPDAADHPVRVRPVPNLTAIDEAADDPQRGVEVNVSSVRGELGKLDPDQLSVRAPFPAKPLVPAPAGWKLVPSDDLGSAFKRDVEIAPGAQLNLTIRPHLLVPDDDGATTFAVVEPGFNQSLQYRQTETVGCLLGESIRRLKEDDARMGQAIRRLEQLLVSLPSPEP